MNVGPASEEIRAEIAAQGPIPFDRFMHLALYGTHGFYTGAGDGSRSGSAGRRGDFITSPEVGPLFGAVVARHLDAEWRRLGEPDEFTVIEAGAGPGTLARSVLAAGPACADVLHYVAVEVSEPQRARHPSGITSASTLPADSIDGVVLANELLDNLPFRLAVFDNGWREAYVDVGRDGSLVELLSAPFDPLPVELPTSAPFGARAPLIGTARRFVDDARALVRRGSVICIDYATARTADLAQRPWRDWLRTYRGHERGVHYLSAPGSQDITTDVPIDQLPEPDALRTQAQYLALHGIDALVDEGKRVWVEQAARPGVEAFTMRSRISEAEALRETPGLGSFLVAQWRA